MKLHGSPATLVGCIMEFGGLLEEEKHGFFQEELILEASSLSAQAVMPKLEEKRDVQYKELEALREVLDLSDDGMKEYAFHNVVR